MIGVSERASQELKELLAARQTPTERAVKLVPGASRGLTMVIDRAREGDAVIESDERLLLIVDASVGDRLDHVVLDMSGEPDGPEGPRFVLRGPER